MNEDPAPLTQEEEIEMLNGLVECAADEIKDRDGQIASLRSQLAEARGVATPRLRPMSEAPKDGTWIMVPQNPMHVGVWQYPAWHLVRWWTETRPNSSNAYDGWHGADGLPVAVADESGWLPLPPTDLEVMGE